MDKLTQYQGILQQELEYQSTKKAANTPNIVSQLVIDETKQQFILLALGWHEKTYHHHFIFHLELKDGKIWIHENRTDIDISEVLVEKGVKKQDIVIAFLSPIERVAAGYAVA